MDMQRELTAEQVAARLDVGVVTVYRYLRRGEMRGYKLGRKSGWKVREGDLEDFIQAKMNDAVTFARKA